MKPLRVDVAAVVLGAPFAQELAEFYQHLLGWVMTVYDDGDWVMLRHPDGGTGLSFQTEPDHVPPAWPAGPGDQQMQIHLDLAVDDVDAAVAVAVEAGATAAAFQPQDDNRVMLDPAGHPFCLFAVTAEV
jgi:predicted enzyme related to lactoylglutathione lyase